MKKHRIIALIISIPAAFLLWLYVVTVVAPNTTAHFDGVSISVSGEDKLDERNLYYSYKNTGVTLDLKGSRVTLDQLNKENIMITADLSNIVAPGTYDLTLSVAYPYIQGSGNIEITYQSVESVTVEVGAYLTKTVPVKLEFGESELQPSLVLDEKNIPVYSIDIFGKDTALESIDYASADCGYLEELTDTDTRNIPYSLRDEEGNAVENLKIAYGGEELRSSVLNGSADALIGSGTVTVTLPVLKEKEVALQVALADTDEYRSTEVEMQFSEESAASVRVRGTVSAVDALGDSLTVGTVSLTGFTDYKLRRTLPVSVPEGITFLDEVDEITVTVTVKDMEDRRFEIPAANIRFYGCPKNVTVNATGPVEVELSGRSDTLNAVSELTAHADYKSILISPVPGSNGKRSGTVLITVDLDGYEGIEASGNLYATIEVSGLNLEGGSTETQSGTPKSFQ